MKIAIIGSRSFTDIYFMRGEFHKCFGGHYYPEDLEIVSGGATGADSCAERLAGDFDLKLKIFPADWNTFGKKAGYLRNQQIIEYSDAVLAFWDGESKGTKLSIDLALKNKKELHVYLYSHNTLDKSEDSTTMEST